MSETADKNDIAAKPADGTTPGQARNRRAATLRVREARDRLTSTSGTRPAFDHELLRQYAQTRISASLVVVLLVVATGVLCSVWIPPIVAAGWTFGVLTLHAIIIRYCRKFLTQASSAPTTTR